MKKAFLCFGQGAQYPGMMKDIYEKHAHFREALDIADRIIGKDLSGLLFSGTQAELDITENTQVCMLMVEVGIVNVLRAYGIYPDMAAGFSLGEWVALVATNVVSYEDALKLVQYRAKVMQEAVPLGEGAMAVAMGVSNEYVEAVCEELDGYIAPSNYNCPGQVSVAGENVAVDAFVSRLETEGYMVNKLAISIPSHCMLMKPAADLLAEAIEKIQFSKPICPLVMNATGTPTKDVSEIKANIIDQLIMPVRFESTLINMLNTGVTDYIEIGPSKALIGFAKRTAKPLGYKISTYRTSDAAFLDVALSELRK